MRAPVGETGMGVVDDFKKFLISGSLVSMAVAFVVGLAIVALIGALVTDIIDPLIGAAGHINFATWASCPSTGASSSAGPSSAPSSTSSS